LFPCTPRHVPTGQLSAKVDVSVPFLKTSWDQAMTALKSADQQAPAAK
jgi:hypothetical protein